MTYLLALDQGTSSSRSIVFKPDPYGRDGRELAALDSPFKLGKRPRL